MNATSEQRTRHLETKVNENLEVIQQLRQERENLESERASLQTQVVSMGKVSYCQLSSTNRRDSDLIRLVKQLDALRHQLTRAQSTQDQARQQLAVHSEEIEELRSVIIEQSKTVPARVAAHRQVNPVKSKPSTSNDNHVTSAVAAADAKLRALRGDVEGCLQELNDLRTERDVLRARLDDERLIGDRAQSQLQLLRDQLEETEHGLDKGKGRVLDHDENACCARLVAVCNCLEFW